MSSSEKSILFVENMDIASPLACTVPYYLTSELADSHTVHVICRRRSARRAEEYDPQFVLHDIDTGEIPILSGLLFAVFSTFYALGLSLHYQYDTVYTFQHELLQGWIGARAADAKLVVGLQCVPVRQDHDLTVANDEFSPRRTISMLLYSGYGLVVKTLLPRATEIVCLTEGIRQIAADEYGINPSDPQVIGMGVDIGTFAPDPDQREQTDSDRWIMTYVGSVAPTRGLDEVVEALAMTDHDIEFRIVGSGPDDYVQSLRDDAQKLGVADRFEWVGIVPHDEVPELLWDSDISVSPLPDHESFRISYPAKLLEYMAAESLVVASDIQPHSRLIDDGENGFLYNGDATALAETLDRCLAREADHEAVQREARATVEQYSWEAIVQEHEAVICREETSDMSSSRVSTLD